MLIMLRSFPDGTLRVFPTSGCLENATEPPPLIQSEKISGEMFRRVLQDFQLKMCGFSHLGPATAAAQGLSSLEKK